jgi:hypothetical protein
MAVQEVSERVVFECGMLQFASRRWKDYLVLGEHISFIEQIHVSLLAPGSKIAAAEANLNLGFYLSNYSDPV